MAAATPASAEISVITPSEATGTWNSEMPSPSSAFTIAHPKPVPIARPSVVPSRAMIVASQRTAARICERVIPTARSKPSSRVRSKIDSASVLAMPSRAMTIASASRA